MASPIQQFTRDLLTRHGALVDPAGDDALEVVAGVDLQARLGLVDYQRLVFSPDAAGSGQLVDYDSPLLERIRGSRRLAHHTLCKQETASGLSQKMHMVTDSCTIKLYRRTK